MVKKTDETYSCPHPFQSCEALWLQNVLALHESQSSTQCRETKRLFSTFSVAHPCQFDDSLLYTPYGIGSSFLLVLFLTLRSCSWSRTPTIQGHTHHCAAQALTGIRKRRNIVSYLLSAGFYNVSYSFLAYRWNFGSDIVTQRWL